MPSPTISTPTIANRTVSQLCGNPKNGNVATKTPEIINIVSTVMAVSISLLSCPHRALYDDNKLAAHPLLFL